MKELTQAERKKQKALSEVNEKSQHFFYKGANFMIVGTHIHSNGSCSHDIKNLDIVDPTKEKYARIADKDLQRILKIARN